MGLREAARTLGHKAGAILRRNRGMWLVLQWFWGLGRAIRDDQCLLRASALTYVTALSIVPLLAVAFSISKGFGFQNTVYIRDFLLRVTGGRELVVENVIGYINRTDVTTLGAVGVVGLFFTVLSLLGSIEHSFNSIWGLKHSRGLGRKFADYLSITLICPLLIIVSFSTTASLQSSVVMQRIMGVAFFNAAYLAFLSFLPFLLVCGAFFLLNKLVPNTRVTFLSAVAGGLVAGLLWTVSERLFLTYQVELTRYNAIYGSFAQVPLFLIWLYVSWVIVLLGAEITYRLQHWETVIQEIGLEAYDFESVTKLAVILLSLLTRQFVEGSGPLSTARMAAMTGTSVKVVNHVCFVLARLKFVVPVCQDDHGDGYGLARDPGGVTLVDVVRGCGRFRRKDTGQGLLGRFAGIHVAYEDLFRTMDQGQGNVTLKDLAPRILPVPTPISEA